MFNFLNDDASSGVELKEWVLRGIDALTFDFTAHEVGSDHFLAAIAECADLDYASASAAAAAAASSAKTTTTRSTASRYDATTPALLVALLSFSFSAFLPSSSLCFFVFFALCT